MKLSMVVICRNIINECVNDASEVISKTMETSFEMGNYRTLKESGYADTLTKRM